MKKKTIESLGGVGILTEADLQDLTAGTARVAHLMDDGEWQTADAVRKAAGSGVPATEGLRRLRELRDIEGVEIQVRRDPKGARYWSYRLVASGTPIDPDQMRLFA